MAYTIEDIVSPLGTGVRVQKKDGGYFSQQVRSDGVMVRSYSSAGYQHNGIVSLECGDFKGYCSLADRVQKVFGKEMPKNPAWFIDVLGSENPTTHDRITIMPVHRYSQKQSDYVSGKRVIPSIISGIVQSSALLGLPAAGIATYGVENNAIVHFYAGFVFIYGVLGGIIENGMRYIEKLEFGPLSFIGSFAAKWWYENKLKDPEYFVKEFRRENEKLIVLEEKLGVLKQDVCNAKQVHKLTAQWKKQCSKVTFLNERINDEFVNTKERAGIHFQYSHKDENYVKQVLEYVVGVSERVPVVPEKIIEVDKEVDKKVEAVPVVKKPVQVVSSDVLMLEKKLVVLPADHVRPDNLFMDRYELFEPLGFGAFGVVYRAKDVELDRDVVVKMPRNVQTTELVRSSAKALAVRVGLEDEHLVSVLDVHHREGMPYVVMECEDGFVLRDVIDQKKCLEPAHVLQVVKELAAALENEVHGDVKPSNILVNLEGGIMLLDPGNSFVQNDSLRHTLSSLADTSSVKGTFGYMAPEILEGGRPTAESDVFSLGQVMYECLTGKLPLGASDSLSDLIKSLPSCVEDLYCGMTRRDPAKRTTISEVSRVVQEAALRPKKFSIVCKTEEKREPIIVSEKAEQNIIPTDDVNSVPVRRRASIDTPFVRAENMGVNDCEKKDGEKKRVVSFE